MRQTIHSLGWLSLVLLGCVPGVALPRASLQSPGALLFNGYTKPDVTCYKCHNGDGTGSGRGPSLKDRVPKLSDAQILRAVDEGPSIMPSYKDKLTGQEKEQILSWLREQFGRATP